MSTAGYDPTYRCEGVDLHLQWAKGYRHQRHVRVAACLQLGKEIISQGNGALCFYASKGIQFPAEEVVREAIGKGGAEGERWRKAWEYYLDKEATIGFEEVRSWA